eukprot:3820751-Pleurochrysis_carterae.AAC.2
MHARSSKGQRRATLSVRKAPRQRDSRHLTQGSTQKQNETAAWLPRGAGCLGVVRCGLRAEDCGCR